MDHPIITALATKAHVSNIDQGSCALRMIKKKSILRSCWYLAPKELHVFSHSFKCELVWRLSWMKFVNLTSYKSWKGWCRQLVPSRVFVNSQLNNNDCLSFNHDPHLYNYHDHKIHSFVSLLGIQCPPLGLASFAAKSSALEALKAVYRSFDIVDW